MDEVAVSDRNGVRTVRLDRPAKRNALTRPMYAALAAALDGAEAAGARAIHLCGSAECFTAGNDLADFNRADTGGRSDAWSFLRAMVQCPVPVVASVNGPAVGVGTTMLLHFDLVYCSATAVFQLPFVTLGLCPEAASSLLLPLRAGTVRAAELLLLGEKFDAATALACGIVNAVLPDPAACDALAAARATALAQQPPDALRTTRRLLRQDAATVLARIEVEGVEFSRLLAGPEARQAMAAAAEKRRPAA